jgi:hypothetical protein
MAEKGSTPGRVINTAIGSRAYFKPSIGKVVLRKPGVIRSSDVVLAVNKILEDLKSEKKEELPAKKCAGKPWRQFVKCMKEEMKKTVTKDKITEILKNKYEEAKKAGNEKEMAILAAKLKARGVVVT